MHIVFFDYEGKQDLVRVIFYFIEQKIQRFLRTYPKLKK